MGEVLIFAPDNRLIPFDRALVGTYDDVDYRAHPLPHQPFEERLPVPYPPGDKVAGTSRGGPVVELTALLHLPSWEDFERMMRDLITVEYGTVAEIEGRKGDKQYGVDVWADLGGVYIVCQCKRWRKVTRGCVADAAKAFTEGPWFGAARGGVFMLAVAGEMGRSACAEWRDAVRVISGGGVKAVLLQGERIETLLRGHPRIVERYFRYLDVPTFCSKGSCDEVERRLLLGISDMEEGDPINAWKGGDTITSGHDPVAEEEKATHAPPSPTPLCIVIADPDTYTEGLTPWDLFEAVTAPQDKAALLARERARDRSPTSLSFSRPGLAPPRSINHTPRGGAYFHSNGQPESLAARAEAPVSETRKAMRSVPKRSLHSLSSARLFDPHEHFRSLSGGTRIEEVVARIGVKSNLLRKICHRLFRKCPRGMSASQSRILLATWSPFGDCLQRAFPSKRRANHRNFVDTTCVRGVPIDEASVEAIWRLLEEAVGGSAKV